MVTAFPGDSAITPDTLKSHKISNDEYARIERVLGRAPSYTELGVFSVMWSEHCSYKSSRVHLRRLPTKGPRVIQGPGENAGVVDIGDGFAAVFKIESHNHPSFIEPYQGAATGVGGILRDVFTMGARPIACLDSLRFGRDDHPRTPELLSGVVAGIGGYGNAFGVPTVGGDLLFDESYDGNILVNAFTCGIARSDRIFYGRATGIGNPILYIGTKTGRDGIHGATMASDEFSAEGNAGGEIATASSIKKGVRSTMQVGDPFMGKLLLEACLELFESDLLLGIQDMGAAGLTSSSVEMAGRAGNGIEIDLDKIPRRAKAMLPYELLLSESQERMLLVAKPGKEADVIRICTKWELDAAVIGKVTDTKRWVVRATPGFDPLTGTEGSAPSQVVCDIPIEALTDDAPVYDRPRRVRERVLPTSVPPSTDIARDLIALLSSANIGSRSDVYRQYDHTVRGSTVVRPGADASVVRVPCEKDGRSIEKYLAFSVGSNGRYVDLAPCDGAKMAVAEVCRNLVCVGAEPIGLTDCLNFASPENPETMQDFSDAIDGIRDACNALGVPVVSGNVSLYNETTEKGIRRAILPTPTVAVVGLVENVEHVLTPWFKNEGDEIYLLGDALREEGDGLGGSEFAALCGARSSGPLPKIDLAREASLQTLVLSLVRSGKLASAHDVSEGGLFVALAECTVGGNGGGVFADPKGAEIHLKGATSKLAQTALLFGESPSRIVVSVSSAHRDALVAEAAKANVPCTKIGRVGGSSLSLMTESAKVAISVAEIQAARAICLHRAQGKTASAN